MGKGKKKVVVESESDSENEAITRKLGRDITKKLGAPFKVYESERKIYENLRRRKVRAPIYIDYDSWKRKADEGDLFATKFVQHIERMGLEKWAAMRLNAYPRLVREFYTSCSITECGELECRFNGKWRSFDKYRIMALFGFFARVAKHEGKKKRDYNEDKWWEEIKCVGIGETERKPVTAIQDNALYYFYRFMATSLWGKDDPSKVPSDELYILWEMENHAVGLPPEMYPINIYLPILSTIRQMKSLVKKNPLSLGAFITVLAESEECFPTEDDIIVTPKKLPGGFRRLRTPLQPWGKMVPIFELRDRNANEDEGFDPNAPRGPAPLALEDETDAEPEAQPEPLEPEAQPVPLEPEAEPENQPAPRARKKKSRKRDFASPGPSSAEPSHVAPYAFDGPSRAEFEEMRLEMRANHREMMDSHEARHRLEMEGQAAIRAELRGSRDDRRMLIRGQASLIADLRGAREDSRMILRAQANLMTELRTMREDLIGKYGYEVSSDGDAFDSEDDGGPSEP